MDNKRPSRQDRRVIEAVADALAEEVKTDRRNLDVDRNDLVIALERSIDLDGFNLARELEHLGYDPNARMVESLDEAGHLARSAHNKLVAEWVRANQITVPFKVGDLVFADLYDGRVEGEIVRVNENLAYCTVHCPSRGHVKEGEGVHGFLVDYEKIRAR